MGTEIENDMTAIRVSKETRNILEKLKVHPNQSFEEVVRKLLEKEGIL